MPTGVDLRNAATSGTIVTDRINFQKVNDRTFETVLTSMIDATDDNGHGCVTVVLIYRGNEISSDDPSCS